MGEKFNATCDAGSVILMTDASFGSRNTGRCLRNAYECEQVKAKLHDLHLWSKNYNVWIICQ